MSFLANKETHIHRHTRTHIHTHTHMHTHNHRVHTHRHNINIGNIPITNNNYTIPQQDWDIPHNTSPTHLTHLRVLHYTTVYTIRS